MNTRILVAALVLFAAGLTSPGSAAEQGNLQNQMDNKITIAIAGDSTVSTYRETSLQKGWGQYLIENLDAAKVKVENLAAGGRSTKTFKSEGRWDKLLATKPKYAFIQFGHNDSHAKGKPESTDANTDYAAYLVEYVASARANSIVPILVTPMHRGTWKADKAHLTEELLPYAVAMQKVATEGKVPLIDLYALSGKAFEVMGDEKLQTLFRDPEKDRTHFNEKGAKYFAGLVVAEANRLVPGFQTDTEIDRN